MSHTERKYLLTLVLAIHAVLASAQLFTVNDLPTQSQLPVANVHCILQDKEGYMWYGTTGGGLCRDDGYQVVTLGKHLAAALPDNDVTCLAEDARHGICVGTRRGLFRVDKTCYHLERLLGERFANLNVSVLQVDEKGRIWAAVDDEVLRLSADGKLQKVYALRWNGKRIRSLRLLQQKRKEIVLTEVELRPDDLDASKIDKAFLQRAVDMMERHLADSEYGVEQVSDDMCMSRMNLYRKMQALTGLSPSDVMRDIRLKNAAQLLKSHPGAPINEVAAKVGFDTPSYFSKCFKQKFGVLPSAYWKNDLHS